MRLTVILALILCGFTLAGAEFPLMKDGKAACCIVTAPDAGVAEQHAAAELAKFLGKIAGGNPPEVSGEPSGGMYPVFLKIAEDSAVSGDGFRIEARADALVISACNPRGILYGVYEILKQYGGIRWLMPGEDGEYFTVKPVIAVPEGNKVYNPSFKFRTFFFESCSTISPMWETYDWILRNNMYIEVSPGVFNNKRLKTGLSQRAAVKRGAIHSFSYLFSMQDFMPSREKVKQLFASSPDMFPLINGERNFKLLENASGGDRAQPCTSNPETVKLMASNLSSLYGKYAGTEFSCMLGNNDGTIWCECDSCRKLDPPECRKIHSPSDRYWVFVNQLAAEVYKKYPDADVRGWAYQNFHNVPFTVKPDPRMAVQLVFNRRCQRHRLDDPKCEVNREYYKHFKDWSQTGNKLFTWEQFNVSGRWFMPMENTFVNDLVTYYKLGVDGAMLVTQPPDGIYGKKHDNTLIPQVWRCMWQTLYLSSALLWDVNRDKDALCEEAGRLYYGKAWEEGLKQFRALLSKTAAETPGCFGHGLDQAAGRCLDAPAAHQQLLAYLSQAENAADGDQRALAHVRKERELFARTWEAARKNYQENYRDMIALERKNPLIIDAVIQEEDWRNANIITDFSRQDKKSCEQTYARITYDRDNFYLAVEAMEPSLDKIKADAPNPQKIWDDSTIELFLHQPELGSEVLHLAVNPAGLVNAAIRKDGGGFIRSVAAEALEVRTKIGDDRWRLECRISASAVGMHFSLGSTWRINIARSRRLHDGTGELSSICGGALHNIATFQPLILGKERVMSKMGERTKAFWQNPTFSQTAPVSRHKNWRKWDLKNGLAPVGWNPVAIGGVPGNLSLLSKSDSKDCYVQISKGGLMQFYQDRSDRTYRVKIRVIAAGKGELQPWLNRYSILPDGKYKYHGPDAKSLKPAGPAILTEQWQEYVFEYEKRSGEVFAFGVFCKNDSEAMIDDISVSEVALIEK